MFVTRLLSGIVLVLLAGTIITYGGHVLLAVTFLISVIGLTELSKILHVEKGILGFTGYIAAAGYYGLLYAEKEEYFLLYSLAYLMVVMAVYVLTFPNYKTDQILLVYFGFFYVALVILELTL